MDTRKAYTVYIKMLPLTLANALAQLLSLKSLLNHLLFFPFLSLFLFLFLMWDICSCSSKAFCQSSSNMMPLLPSVKQIFSLHSSFLFPTSQPAGNIQLATYSTDWPAWTFFFPLIFLTHAYLLHLYSTIYYSPLGRKILSSLHLLTLCPRIFIISPLFFRVKHCLQPSLNLTRVQCI